MQGVFPQEPLYKRKHLRNVHNKVSLQTKVCHLGPTGAAGNSFWICCSFLYVTLKTFHTIPSVHWGCSTICPPGMWSDALQPSQPAAMDFLWRPSIAHPTASDPQGGPCCRPEFRPSQYLIRKGKEDLTLSALCAGLLPARLHASLLMSAPPSLTNTSKFTTVLIPSRYPTDRPKDI